MDQMIERLKQAKSTSCYYVKARYYNKAVTMFTLARMLTYEEEGAKTHLWTTALSSKEYTFKSTVEVKPGDVAMVTPRTEEIGIKAPGIIVVTEVLTEEQVEQITPAILEAIRDTRSGFIFGKIAFDI